MLCQHCNKNEAEIKFMFDFMGRHVEVNLCHECAARLHGFYEGRLGQYDAPQAPGERAAAGLDVGDIRHQRKLNEMQVRLRIAISNEEYEEAARLRDEIAEVEKEVCV